MLVESLIRLIETDAGLPLSIRQEAGRIRNVAANNPDAAMEELDRMAERVALGLATEDPVDDLAKYIGIENFWMFYLDENIKNFVDSATYRLMVERSINPADRLERDLSSRTTLIDRIHSWLVVHTDVSGLPSSSIQAALVIRHPPPYVALVFPLVLLLANGVRVRETRATDAIPERLVEWRPGNLPTGARQVIDGNVPRSAVGGTKWLA
jgi:hypothetical protein